jgi:hypothetical protein
MVSGGAVMVIKLSHSNKFQAAAGSFQSLHHKSSLKADARPYTGYNEAAAAQLSRSCAPPLGCDTEVISLAVTLQAMAIPKNGIDGSIMHTHVCRSSLKKLEPCGTLAGLVGLWGGGSWTPGWHGLHESV